MHIRISLDTKFQLKLTILFFFGPNLPQKGIFCGKQKSGYNHCIRNIQISLSIKFQLKLIILIFWTKYVQKGYFQSKMVKSNITIEFCILKLV